jgi:hypothetical protein
MEMSMKSIKISILAAAVILCAAAGIFYSLSVSHPEPEKLSLRPETFKAEHIFIVVLDGLRNSEGFGDPSRKHIPGLSSELAPLGARCDEFWIDGPTYTLAGHTALTTGFYQDINNNGLELPAHPSIFQYWLSAAGSSVNKAWIVCSKDKLIILGNTLDRKWNGISIPSLNCGVNGRGLGSGYRDDKDTLEKIFAIAAADAPRLMLVNFKEPDQSGHSGSMDLYIDGIEHSDANAVKLWKWLQSQPEFKDTTDVFFTSDHGRHSEGINSGFKDHGDKCDGCRRSWLLAVGPDFKKGFISSARAQQIDIPATAAALLGFTIPGSQGRILNELIVSNSK